MTATSFVSYARKFMVALVAALGVAALALSDNVISSAEWLQIIVAFAGALGVYAVPNEKPTRVD